MRRVFATPTGSVASPASRVEAAIDFVDGAREQVRMREKRREERALAKFITDEQNATPSFSPPPFLSTKSV